MRRTEREINGITHDQPGQEADFYFQCPRRSADFLLSLAGAASTGDRADRARRRRARRLLQTLILHFSPERCSPVYAEPATLGEIRSDLQRGGLHHNLGELTLRRAVLAMKQAERRLRGHRYKQPAFVEKDIQQDPEFRADLEKIGASCTSSARWWAANRLPRPCSTPVSS